MPICPLPASAAAPVAPTSSAGASAAALSPKWSARFDYQFTNFSSEKVNYPGGQFDFDPDANTYRGSLIYRF